MKKILNNICCAVGGILIGFFANKLDTVLGCVLFTLGVVMLATSTVLMSKENGGD